MHVITRRRLRDFWHKHPDARVPLGVWFALVSRKAYASTHEVKKDFATASFLGGYRTVFNIGGNDFRLVVDMRYDLGRVYIRHVLTHAEYTRRVKAGTL
jgi:mRNA interferase HigB